MRKTTALALIQLTFLAACGGGGGYGGGGGGNPPPPPSQNIATPGMPNVEPLTVDSGPQGVTAVNLLYVTVKVCVPGSTTNCKTIDHIQVDTGAVGLRILASALASGTPIALPPEKDGSGHPMAECLQFGDLSSAWGSLATADLILPTSGEKASNINVEIIADPAYPSTMPQGCSGTPLKDVVGLQANGQLGIGPFINDCNSTGPCPIPSGPQNPVYFSCPTSSTCAAAAASLAQQLQNPVTLFATDKNGVIVELRPVGSAGATTVTGSLVFGIGTQGNNVLPGSATVLPGNATSAVISATYKGTTYTSAFLDAGSNANFFTDSSLSTSACPTPNQSFYCPASEISESATLQGTNGVTLAAPFSVANANGLFANTSYAAFNNLGGQNPGPQGFDLGLPFFFGRNVFIAIEMQNTSGGMGPYFAY